MSETTPTTREASGGRNRYKATLNLPKTDFPMRADLARNEPITVERWTSGTSTRRCRRRAATREPFVFHDGPPYANGNIHVGHLLNKVLKDFVVRSRLMDGPPRRVRAGLGLPRPAHRAQGDDRARRERQDRQARRTPDDDQRRMAIRRECREVRREASSKLQSRADAAPAHARRLRRSLPDHGPRLRGGGAGGLRRARGAGPRLPRPASRCTGRSRTGPRSPTPSSSTRTARTRRSSCDFEAVDPEAVAKAFGDELDATPHS